MACNDGGIGGMLHSVVRGGISLGISLGVVTSQVIYDGMELSRMSAAMVSLIELPTRAPKP